MKLLHLVIQDEKTLRLIVARFSEVHEITSRYLVFSHSKFKGGGSYGDEVRFVKSRYLFPKKFSAEVEWCDAIIIHFMTPQAAYVALHAGNNKPIVWCGWGADYYSYISPIIGNLILPDTAALVARSVKHRIAIGTIKNQLKRIVSMILYNQWESRIFKRVNYFSAPIKEDYKLLKIAHPMFRAKYLQITYGSVETLFGGCDNGKMSGGNGNILVGNSATPTNNHIEIFKQLQQLKLEGRKIIVPLSYGDAEYREQIIKIGQDMFGGGFLPLTDFMPLDDYHSLIGSCSVAIMNHKRQQALGNINLLLYQGVRVFLNSDGVVYSFFAKHGAHVFSVVEMVNMGRQVFEPLSDEEIQQNRAVIGRFWGHERVLSNVRQLSRIIVDNE